MHNDFKPLQIRGRELIPIVQGGMGVAISASSLSSAVARENGVGTIASVDLRHLHEDLLADSKIDPTEEKYDRLNRIALDREIKTALKNSEGRGMIAVNVMKAVKDHPALVKQACESGAHAIVMGAGLPLDLPEMVEDHPEVALFPILSESRGINIVLKRWMKKNKLPDAIVIEHPNHAAGHLGAATVAGLNDARFEFDRVLEETFEVFKKLDLESEKIPLILAGGMANFDKIGGVSFNKGCYPGQEIVARAQYLGKVKRHLYQLRATSAVAPGDSIYAPDDLEHPCGIIVNAAPSPDGGFAALAVLQESLAETTDLCVISGGLSTEVSAVQLVD